MPLVFRPLKDLSRYLQSLVEGRLWAKVLLGLVLGVLVGALLGPGFDLVAPARAQTITSWMALPGNLFLRLVQMIMVPLIVTSIMQGIAGGESGAQLRKMGLGIGVYFVLTTALSVGIGLLMALWLRPGKLIDAGKLGVQSPAPTAEASSAATLDIPGAISQILPANPLASMVSGEMLSVVVFAIVTGLALTAIDGKKAEPILGILSSVQEVCMTITRWAMRLAPFAVFGLISQVVARVGLDAITGLAFYVITVLVGLITLAILYLLALTAVAGVQPLTFLRECRELLLLAFSVASSAPVMPLSLKTMEERMNVAPSVARFVIPLGATINMNGTAAYQAIATVFLAQVYGLELGVMNLLLLVVTTVAASIGTPSTPGAGVIILATILTSVGIPVEGVALIIGVDNLLGMCRAAVNVMGDLTATLIFDKLEKRRAATRLLEQAA